MKHTVCVLGKDARQNHIRSILSKKGFKITSSIPNCTALILPIPTRTDLLSDLAPYLSMALGRSQKEGLFCMGSAIPEEYQNTFQAQGIRYENLMASPVIQIKNAIATAEAILAEAILSSEKTLYGSQILVYGFGRCGEMLCGRLRSFHCRLHIQENDPITLAKALAHGYQAYREMPDGIAETADYVFNTVPSPVLCADVLCKMPDSVQILDLASSPGGTDFSYCKEHHLHAELYSGLPARYSPESSAQILAEEILARLEA